MKKFLSILLALAVGFTFTFGSAMSAFAATPNKADADTAIATQVQASYETIDEAATKLVEKTFTYEDGYLVSAGDSNELFTGNTAKGLVSKETIQKKVNELVSTAKTNVQTTAENQYNAGQPLATPPGDAAYTQSNINQAVLNVKNAGIAQAAGINAEAILGTVTSGAYPMTIITGDVVKTYEKEATDAITALEAKVDEYSDLAKDKMAVSTATVNGTTLATVSGLSGDQTPQAIVKGIIATQKNAISTAKTTLGASTAVNDFITAIESYQTAAKNAEDFILGHKKTATEDYYIAPIPTKTDLANDTTVATAKNQAVLEVNSVMDTKILVVKNGLNNALISYNEYASLTTAQAKDKAALEKAIANLDAQVAAAKEVYAARINAKKSLSDVNSAKTTITTEIGNYATTWNTFKANDATSATETEELLISMTTILDNIATVKKEAALIAEIKDVNGKPYVDADALADDLEKAIASLYNGGTLSDALAMLSNSSQEVVLLATKQNYIDWINGTTISGLNPKDSKGNVLSTAWKKADAAGAATVTTITPFTTTPYSVNNADLYEEEDAKTLTALVDETKEAITAATSIADIKSIFAAANDKYEAIETTTAHVTNWNSGKVGTAYTKAKYEKELAAYATYFVGKVDTTKYPTAVSTANNVLENVVYPIVYTAKTADELASKVAEAKAAVDAIKSTDDIKAAAADVDALIAKINTPATIADKEAIIAAAEAKAAYDLIPGTTGTSYVTKALVLNAAIAAYEKADAIAINDAYAALAKKTVITTDDAAAIEALRAQFDAHKEFVEKYSSSPTTTTVTEANLSSTTAPLGLEVKLSDAKVKAVSELLTKLPAEVKATDKAQIEAARAAYEALTLAEKRKVMSVAGGVLYKNLLNAEADLEKATKWTDADAKAYVFDQATKATSVKLGAKKVKVTANFDASKLIENGYTVEYKFYKSTKKSSGYKYTGVTKPADNATYTNTNAKKGKNYYKFKVVVKNADGTVILTTALKDCKYACRTIK